MWPKASHGPLRAALWGVLARPRQALPGARERSAQPGGRCWSCGDPLAGGGSPAPRFCPACRALQPPEPRQDLFRLMGCDRTFRVDVALLQQRFRTLQRLLHPDYFSRRPQREQDFSDQHSSLVNKAYQTLLNPLSRGLYLLELNGVELEEGTDTEADPEFLLEIMEMNEKLSEAHNDAKIEEIENTIAAKQAELVASVSRAFEKDDLQEAKKLLAKMKYFANLEEKVKKRRIPS
ncbi:iron-sulfur cluster co-chaperone protein HscB isoform X1 [Varanus komodoensis]|uniref:iron-sulfur cluster co-chaperone protein HscB isoform X1 n=1 Tax=Varanus komodoensis TaxID=61221 RepID=UPI001CF7B789|nr:iron-sulfur cluster co-chaperone protein HscB isoform X1 [Varanus komodoensis]